MAVFKCNQTGNTVEFNLEWDIIQMKAHPDYTEVTTPVVTKTTESKEKKPAVKSDKD